MWQPIETAPKLEDVTLLGFIKDKEFGNLFGPIQFSTRYDIDDGEVSAWEVYAGAVCYEGGGIVKDYHLYKYTITHWMPLPEPPNG